MRLFWAIAPPQEVVTAVDVAAQPLRARWPDLRWTAPERWHVTVAFLGDVADDLVDAVVAAVRDGVEGCEPVHLRLLPQAGTPGRRSGVVWVPVAPTPQTHVLASTTQDACRTVLGGGERRAWQGHLTLARIPRRAPAPGRLAAEVAAAYEGPDVGWTAAEVVLLHSTTAPDGARYEPLAVVALGGRSDP